MIKFDDGFIVWFFIIYVNFLYSYKVLLVGLNLILYILCDLVKVILLVFSYLFIELVKLREKVFVIVYSYVVKYEVDILGI